MIQQLWQLLTPESGAHLHGTALFVCLAGFGLIVGVLSGLFGVGGGFIIVPMLNLLFGMSYDVAVGSSLSFTIGTGASGVSCHSRLGNVAPRTTTFLSMSAIVGAILGSQLHHWLKIQLGGAQGRGFESVMNALFIILLLVSAYLVYRGPVGQAKDLTILQRMPIGPFIDLPTVGRGHVSVPGLVVLGAFVGILTGMLGIGGGVLYMPLLLLVVGMTPHKAVGTSLGVVLVSSAAATIKHGLAGNVNLMVAMALLIGSTSGVQIGVALCQKIHAQRLRRYFAFLALAVALALVVKLLKDAPPSVRRPAGMIGAAG